VQISSYLHYIEWQCTGVQRKFGSQIVLTVGGLMWLEDEHFAWIVCGNDVFILCQLVPMTNRELWSVRLVLRDSFKKKFMWFLHFLVWRFPQVYLVFYTVFAKWWKYQYCEIKQNGIKLSYINQWATALAGHLVLIVWTLIFCLSK